MAISYVNSFSAASTAATLSGVAAGDIILVYAYRSTTTAPTLATGFTNITNGSGNTSAYRVGYKVATGGETTTGTWTNATIVKALIYRGVASIGTGTGSTHAAATTGASPTITLTKTTGKSWVVSVQGSNQTTSMSTPASMTLRGTNQTATGAMIMTADTNAGVTSSAARTTTLGTSATGNGVSIELVAPETTPSAPTQLTADATAFGSTTPNLNFTATDAEGDDLTYEVQIDSTSTFSSTTGAGTPTFVQGVQNSNATATTLPANVQVGNTILVGYTENVATEPAMVTSNLGLTWSKINKVNDTLGGNWIIMYAATVTTAGSLSVNNIGGGSTYVAEYSSIDITKSMAIPTATGSGAASPSASITPPAANSLLAAVGFDEGTATQSAGTNYTMRGVQTNNSTFERLMFEDGVAQTTTPTTISYSGATGAYGLVAVGIQPGIGPIPAIDKVSGVDAGFSNVTVPADTNPFTSGNTIKYTVQTTLATGTYYWRVRAKDTGSGLYSAWSTTRSFAYGVTVPSFTKTHTTDTFKRSAISKTHTTDVFKRKQVTKTHTTDVYSTPYYRKTRSHTTDVLKSTVGGGVVTMNTGSSTFAAGANGANTFSFTTPTTTNGLLLVPVYNDNTVTSVTYNGLALTRAESLSAAVPAPNWYYLVNPPAGTFNLVINRNALSTNRTTKIYILENVNQTSPIGGYALGSLMTTGTVWTVSQTVGVTGSMVFDSYNNNTGSAVGTITLVPADKTTDPASVGSATSSPGNISYSVNQASGTRSYGETGTTSSSQIYVGAITIYPASGARQMARLHTTDTYKVFPIPTRIHRTDTFKRYRTNYSRINTATLPTTNADLATAFSDADYSTVAADDSTYVDAAGNGYAIFEFKYEAPSTGLAVTATWNGKTTTAPSVSTVYLQIWNYTTSAWETLASNNTAAANTDFTLTATQSTNLANYYSGNIVTTRLYQ